MKKTTIPCLYGFPLEHGYLMVYIKFKNKYEPLADLLNKSIAKTVKDAVLVPFDHLELLKQWANDIENLCKEYNVSIQIRNSIDQKEVLHQVN